MERLDAFLKAWPAEFPVAVEIRNKGLGEACLPGLSPGAQGNFRADGSSLDAAAGAAHGGI
jgi:hypothetical protein